MSKQRATVVGAGNGGVTAAYHLAKMGLEVCIYGGKQIAPIKERGGIEALAKEHGCNMILAGFEEIALATTDMKEAVEFSDILVMICPSFVQEIFFEKMLPHLKSGQTIYMLPGNYGGLYLNELKNKKGYKDLALNFVDAISIPWACRISAPATITIMGIKEYMPLSIALGDTKASTEEVAKLVQSVTPIKIEVLKNPLIAGLENINYGGHPLLTTLNMGILENFDGDFNYYRDCCSTATAAAAAKMESERMSVGAAYGFGLKSELEAMNSLYASNYKSVYDFNRDSTTHGKINKAPNSSKSRYITEDVPYLLVPCFDLAKKAGLSVPIVESCIHIASAYNDENYFETGRTLEKMGLGHMSFEEIKARFGL